VICDNYIHFNKNKIMMQYNIINILYVILYNIIIGTYQSKKTVPHMQPPGRFTNPNNNLITHSLQVINSNIYIYVFFTGHSYIL